MLAFLIRLTKSSPDREELVDKVGAKRMSNRTRLISRSANKTTSLLEQVPILDRQRCDKQQSVEKPKNSTLKIMSIRTCLI